MERVKGKVRNEPTMWVIKVNSKIVRVFLIWPWVSIKVPHKDKWNAKKSSIRLDEYTDKNIQVEGNIYFFLFSNIKE